eukprot:jgi/Bigna1/79312/fgenesh1_pg.61_\
MTTLVSLSLSLSLSLYLSLSLFLFLPTPSPFSPTGIESYCTHIHREWRKLGANETETLTESEVIKTLDETAKRHQQTEKSKSSNNIRKESCSNLTAKINQLKMRQQARVQHGSLLPPSSSSGGAEKKGGGRMEIEGDGDPDDEDNRSEQWRRRMEGMLRRMDEGIIRKQQRQQQRRAAMAAAEETDDDGRHAKAAKNNMPSYQALIQSCGSEEDTSSGWQDIPLAT